MGVPGCHDGEVFERLRPRHLVVAAVVSFGLLGAGCSRDRAASPVTIDQGAATETLGTNPFIPEDVNIGDCLSSLPRPGCGNRIRGDYHSMITFGVLIAGLTFIGWRIARGARRGQAPRNTPAPNTPARTATPDDGTPDDDAPNEGTPPN